MSDDDKLVRAGVDIATAEAFAKTIGRAIEENDVTSAQVLSGELRAKLAPAELLCQRCGHRFDRHEITPGATSGCDNYLVVRGNWCGCTGFVFPEGTVGAALANTTNERPVRSLFNEGKHYAKLRAVFFERTMNGEQLVCFKLEITKSRQMATGVEVVHALPVRRQTQMNIAAAQLDRLGIDRDAVNGMLGSNTVNNMNLDVVVVAVEKLTRKGDKVMSTWLRKFDDTDDETLDFGPDWDASEA